jgi:hypothetical protein
MDVFEAFEYGAKLAMADFRQSIQAGDPEGRQVNKDRRRYNEKPGQGFVMADTKRLTRNPSTNQYGNDHTTVTYPSVGGNLQDDFTGKKSRSGQFNNPTRVGKTFLP